MIYARVPHVEGWQALALACCLACGGTAAAGPGLRATIGDVNSGMAERGLRLDEEGWLELTLPDHGWERTQELDLGECLTAVAMSDAGSVVFVHLDEHRGAESDGASWGETCSHHAERSVRVRLTGPPDTVVAFALFTGPVGGDTFARAYFGAEAVEPAPAPPPTSGGEVVDEGTDEAPPAPQTEVAQRCVDDEARAHYRRGIRAAREESFDEAADAFALAYACQPDGTILFNLASVTARQGRLAEAREMYLQLLRDHLNIPPALHAEIDSALESLRRPGTLVVRMRRGDEVFINDVGVEAPRRGRTVRRLRIRVLPGAHTVVLLEPSGARHQARVQTEAGRETEVDPRRAESP